MVWELGCFLLAALVIMLPGVLLAGWLGLGESLVERASHGGVLGLAAACYLGSLVSHFDLRWFFPVWGIFFVVVLVGYLKARRGRAGLDHSHRDVEFWVVLVLILVGIIRFAFALPESFPRGWDPAFHMILAQKIRLTHHAIYDWSPFESAALDYPTGSHVLVVVMSWLSGRPLQTVFKDLIPLTGVLSTAEVYILSRRFTDDAAAGLFAAIAYGFWAIDGSIGYALWGGMPNELGMLFFIAMFAVWMEIGGRGNDEIRMTKDGGNPLPCPPPEYRERGSERVVRRVAAMGLLYAGVVLVHHHVMVSSALVLWVCLVWSILRGRGGEWKSLLAALVIAGVLDGFFLVPFFAHAGRITSTHVFYDGEQPVNPLAIPGERLGYVFTLASIVGLALLALRRGGKMDGRMIWAAGTLIFLFVICDYVLPGVFGEKNSTVFTASRFLADAVYFLAAAAGVAAARLRRAFGFRVGVMCVILLGLGTSVLGTWRDIATMPDVPEDFVAACGWIKGNTPADAIVANVETWTSYLTWRRTILTPIPISEPIRDPQARALHLMGVFSGKEPAEAGLYVVQIVRGGDYDPSGVLWKDETGLMVIQLWPR